MLFGIKSQIIGDESRVFENGLAKKQFHILVSETFQVDNNWKERNTSTVLGAKRLKSPFWVALVKTNLPGLTVWVLWPRTEQNKLGETFVKQH